MPASTQPIEVFDDTVAALGEGPLWHPQRASLFWFDITGQRLYERAADQRRQWRFDEPVSAAGWIDAQRLLVASASGLWDFNANNGTKQCVAEIESDNPLTRSNDGRADPWGGFWIGTMGRRLEPGAGSIYRFYRGELRKLFSPLTVPNSICFTPDRRYAYFSDSPTSTIWKQALHPASGWPAGDATVFLCLEAERLLPDGALVDAEGCLWNAQWGSGRVVRYSPGAIAQQIIEFPARHTSCPAFGGPSLSTLFVTTAAEDLTAEQMAAEPNSGKVFCVEAGVKGQSEHRVVLFEQSA